MTKIYLASRSSRRKELLQQLRIEFDIIDVNIDETWDGQEQAGDYVCRLALEKARAGRTKVSRPLDILAADTEVVIDETILGKPKDRADAISMLQMLSGRTHQVYSAVAKVNETEQVVLNISVVSFKPLSIEECETYCDTGEPLGKAGAYAIQGRAAAFITKLEGSYSGVMGLPLEAVRELLKLGANAPINYRPAV